MNALAWRLNRREGDRNLNRNLGERPHPRDNEDRVGNVLCRLIRDHDVLIDLQSFSAEGDPMVLIGPEDNDGPDEPFAHAARETALARAMRAALEIREPILALQDGDRLSRRYRAAEPVRKGQVIGRRQSGADIVVPEDGALIFASETASAGTELCFLCRNSPRLS